MAREPRRLAGGEPAAFDKLDQGLRYAIEGATEVGVYRGEQGWMVIAVLLQQVQGKIAQLKVAGRQNAANLELTRAILEGRKG